VAQVARVYYVPIRCTSAEADVLSARGSDGMILEESPPRNTTTWIRWRPNLVDDRLSEQIRTRARSLDFMGEIGFERATITDVAVDWFALGTCFA
jgi:hypothetical protein